MGNIFFKNYCSLLDVPTSKSAEGIIWQILLQMKEYWLWIGVGLLVIVLVEILTRHENSYNSANGFTPEFNRMVGSLSYMLLQLAVYFSIHLIVGNIAYCFPWPYVAHALVFSLNFAILHGIGFWPEKPKPKRYYRRKRKW